MSGFKNVRPDGSTQLFRSSKNGPSPRQQKERPWCDHCKKPEHREDTCRDLHGKPTDWKLRQNARNQSYQVGIDSTGTKNSTSSSAFNSEQLEQLYKMFSNFQTTSSSGSLAHRGNFFRTLNITAHARAPWIIDSGASNHMTDSYNLFITYSTCAVNLKVKIANGSLLEKGVSKSLKRYN